MTDPKAKIVVSAEDKASATFRRIRGEIDSMKASTATLRNIIGPLGPQLAGAFTVAAVGAWVNRVVEGVDALNDLKDATGASIENLSAMEDVALRTGTSLDTAGAAVLKLNQALNTASDPKSAAAAAIRALGLSVEDLKRLDPVLALQKIGVALGGFADDGNKGRIIMELLGRSSKDLAPLLKDLAEAGTLQAKVTTQQAEATEAFNKQLFGLQKNSTDTARAIAGPLVAAANELFGVLRGDGAGAIEKWLAVPLQAVTVLGGNIAFVLKGVGTELGGIAAQAAALARGDFAGARGIGEMMRKDGEAARAEFDKWERRMLALGSAAQASYSNEGRGRERVRRSLPSSIGGGDKGNGKTRKDQIDEAQQALASYVSGLEKAITREQDLSAEQEAQAFLKSLGATGEIEQVRELVLRLAAEKDMREEIAGMAKLGADARSALIAKQIEDQERLNRLLGATPDRRYKALGEDMRFLDEQLQSGAITSGEWASGIGDLGKKWADVGGKIEEIGKTGKNVGEEIGLVFSSAAGDAITRWQGVGNLFKGILADVAQIGVRELVTKPLSGWLTKLLASADGNAFGPGGVIPFASGGIVNSPTLFKFANGTGLMGEAGPEAIMPLARGRDGKLGVASAGGGAIAIYQTNHFGTGVSRNEVAAALEINKRQTIAAIVDARRRGYAGAV